MKYVLLLTISLLSAVGFAKTNLKNLTCKMHSPTFGKSTLETVGPDKAGLAVKTKLGVIQRNFTASLVDVEYYNFAYLKDSFGKVAYILYFEGLDRKNISSPQLLQGTVGKPDPFIPKHTQLVATLSCRVVLGN